MDDMENINITTQDFVLHFDGVILDINADLSGYQTKSNLVTSLSAQSTNVQYPSAKCVYDIIGNIETLLSTI